MQKARLSVLTKRKRAHAVTYPLFCTVAQTGQFFHVHHRPGNLDDSNGAADFMMRCFDKAQSELPTTRFDVFDNNKVQFAGFVPFESIRRAQRND
jgi:hypothetical protein